MSTKNSSSFPFSGGQKVSMRRSMRRRRGKRREEEKLSPLNQPKEEKEEEAIEFLNEQFPFLLKRLISNTEFLSLKICRLLWNVLTFRFKKIFLDHRREPQQQKSFFRRPMLKGVKFLFLPSLFHFRKKKNQRHIPPFPSRNKKRNKILREFRERSNNHYILPSFLKEGNEVIGTSLFFLFLLLLPLPKSKQKGLVLVAYIIAGRGREKGFFKRKGGKRGRVQSALKKSNAKSHKQPLEERREEKWKVF